MSDLSHQEMVEHALQVVHDAMLPEHESVFWNISKKGKNLLAVLHAVQELQKSEVIPGIEEVKFQLNLILRHITEGKVCPRILQHISDEEVNHVLIHIAHHLEQIAGHIPPKPSSEHWYILGNLFFRNVRHMMGNKRNENYIFLYLDALVDINLSAPDVVDDIYLVDANSLFQEPNDPVEVLFNKNSLGMFGNYGSIDSSTFITQPALFETMRLPSPRNMFLNDINARRDLSKKIIDSSMLRRDDFQQTTFKLPDIRILMGELNNSFYEFHLLFRRYVHAHFFQPEAFASFIIQFWGYFKKKLNKPSENDLACLAYLFILHYVVAKNEPAIKHCSGKDFVRNFFSDMFHLYFEIILRIRGSTAVVNIITWDKDFTQFFERDVLETTDAIVDHIKIEEIKKLKELIPELFHIKIKSPKKFYKRIV